jgi:HEAT repeat protein
MIGQGTAATARGDGDPTERRLVGQLLALSFFLGGALVFVDIAARALFLERFDATLLPYTYIGAAIVIPLCSLAYTRLAARFSLITMTIGTVLLLLLSSAALRIGLWVSDASWLIFFLFIWFRLFYAFNGIVFWGLTGRLFTLRQGKRLFGVVGSGEPVAGVIGYFSAAVLAGWMGTANLLLVAIFNLTFSLLILFLIVRSTNIADAPTAQHDRLHSLSTAQAPGRFERYPLLIMVIAVAMILTYLLVDYAFSAESQAVFQNAEELAGFFGAFFGVVAIVRIIARSTISGFVLTRFGLRTGLLALPVALSVATMLLLLLGGPLNIALAVFGGAALARFLGSVLQPSLQRSAQMVLYQPLPSDQRLRVQATVEGTIEPIATGVAGLLLLGLSLVGGTATLLLAGLILAISLGWIVVVLRTSAEYRQALSRALSRRLVEGGALTFDDAASRELIERALASPLAGEVVYALDLIERGQPDLLPARLPALLQHPDPQVRSDVVRRVERLELDQLVPALRQVFLVEHDPEVRVQQAQALAVLDQETGPGLEEAAFHDPEPQVRAALLCGILRRGGSSATRSEQVFDRLCASSDPAERMQAAQILRRLQGEQWVARLIALMGDPDLDVRRIAFRASGYWDDQQTLDQLLSALQRPAQRGMALNALIRRGSAVLSQVAERLAQPDLPVPVGVSLARLCGRVKGETAIGILLDHIDHPEYDVRHAVRRSLRRADYQARGSAVARIRTSIIRDAETARWLQVHIASFPATGAAEALLHASLVRQQERLRQNLFALLTTLYDPIVIRRVEAHLASQAADKRDLARELLELQVDAPILAAIEPLLAWQPPAAGQADLAGLLDAPRSQLSTWVRACALYVAGMREYSDLFERVHQACSDSDAIVREVAHWAAARLGSTEDAEPAPAHAGLLTVEKVQILKAVPIFVDTADELLAEVASYCTEVELAGDFRIFDKGDPGDSMYIVVSGSVRVHDAELELNRIGANEVFGEMALLDPAPRSASITTLEPLRALRLDAIALQELMEDRVEIARAIITMLTRRLRGTLTELQRVRRLVETDCCLSQSVSAK